MHTDPRFQLPSKKHVRTTLDHRFEHMLRDPDFVQKGTVDRYGRKLARDSGRRELRRFYRLDDGSEQEEEQRHGERGDDDVAVRRELARADAKLAKQRSYDPLREGGFLSSSSSSSSEETSSAEEDDAEDEAEQSVHVARAEAAKAGIPMGKPTTRLAAVNMDWDNIRAVDLMVVAASFVPPDGRILSVAIYPSDFGRERLRREERDGPPREIFAKGKGKDKDKAEQGREGSQDDVSSDFGVGSEKDDVEEEEEARMAEDLAPSDDAGDEDFDSQALRRYQLSRLRYYYAVLTCSSVAAAQALYDSLDGREYLSSANFFDLRFVPADVNLDDSAAHDRCDSLPSQARYCPNEFRTDALTHSKVRLTWDADDVARSEAQRRAFLKSKDRAKAKGRAAGAPDDDDADLRAYLGSSSSATTTDAPSDADSDAPNSKKDKAAALRAKLGLAAPSDRGPGSASAARSATADGPMQITFSAGLSAGPPRRHDHSVFENAPPPEPEPEPRAEPEPRHDETTVEKYVRKERERKARRRARTVAGREAGSGAQESDGSSSASALPKDPAQSRSADADPWDDPFFDSASDDAVPAKKPEKTEKKARKKAKRHGPDADADADADAAAAAAAAAAARERAELELLMLSDHADPAASPTVPTDAIAPADARHFDMAAIVRAEKAAAKTARKRQSRRDAAAAAAAQALGDAAAAAAPDTFRIDAADPRFAALYASPDFALDPTNPRFRPTAAMRALLDEGRRRKHAADGAAAPGPQPKKRKRTDADRELGLDRAEFVDDAAAAPDELRALAARVKARAKAGGAA